MDDDTNAHDKEDAGLWFAQLAQEHYAPALRYAARLLRDATEAEDCVQEAFAEAFQSRASLREVAAAAAWLRSIVRHRCLRRTRRRDLEILPFAGELDELERPCSDGVDERHQRAALAQLLVRALPAHEREIEGQTRRAVRSTPAMPRST